MYARDALPQPLSNGDPKLFFTAETFLSRFSRCRIGLFQVLTGAVLTRLSHALNTETGRIIEKKKTIFLYTFNSLIVFLFLFFCSSGCSYARGDKNIMHNYIPFCFCLNVFPSEKMILIIIPNDPEESLR